MSRFAGLVRRARLAACVAAALTSGAAAAQATVQSPPPPSAHPAPGSFEARILAVHNRARAAIGVAPLAWDDTLARDSAVWAEYIREIGTLAHSPEDATDIDPAGENLWAGTHGAYTPEEMVDYWVRERAVYRPGVFPDNSTTGNVADVAHYTQVVWRSTRRVGCALAEGEDDDFLVCRYKEGGNVMDEVPY